MKRALIQIRFQRNITKQDFKKIYLFVDIASKKILYCFMTNERLYDLPHLKYILGQCNWIKFEIIICDKGYDSIECFNEIKKLGVTPGIPVRKNSIIVQKGPQPIEKR